MWRKFDYSLCFTAAGLLPNVLTEKGALDNNMGYQPDAISSKKNRLRCICCLSVGFVLIICEKELPTQCALYTNDEVMALLLQCVSLNRERSWPVCVIVISRLWLIYSSPLR